MAFSYVAFSVIPLALFAALLALHSSWQSFTVFCPEAAAFGGGAELALLSGPPWAEPMQRRRGIGLRKPFQ